MADAQERPARRGQGGVSVNTEQQLAIVDAAVAALGEHFDSVQILVSTVEGTKTRCIKRGSGNWYARQGMAHEFVNEDVAVENARQIADRLNPPDEGWKKS